MHLPHNLSKKILAWYDNNRRELPWRVSKKSPKKLYYRLLSEFMLQQTRQGSSLLLLSYQARIFFDKLFGKCMIKNIIIKPTLSYKV